MIRKVYTFDEIEVTKNIPGEWLTELEYTVKGEKGNNFRFTVPSGTKMTSYPRSLTFSFKDLPPELVPKTRLYVMHRVTPISTAPGAFETDISYVNTQEPRDIFTIRINSPTPIKDQPKELRFVY